MKHDTQPPAAQLWMFHDAPRELRDLSSHGGDEDWVLLVPKSMDASCYMDSIAAAIGVCGTSRDVLPNGDVVYIGAHA